MVSQVVAGCQGSCECNFIQYLQTTINFRNISDIGCIPNITEIQKFKICNNVEVRQECPNCSENMHLYIEDLWAIQRMIIYIFVIY